MIRKKLVSIINSYPIIQDILYSPFLDYHQYALLRFVKKQAKTIKPNESILDAGAGELKYKKYFGHCKYVSNDLCIGDQEWYFDDIDIKSSIYEIPVEDSSFEYVLCSQVLEHLEYPDKAFQEFNRILKLGGKLFVTAPLGQGEHQIPYDYFRYTQYGLKSLGERSGFKRVFIEPHGGIFINMEYMLWQAFSIFIPFKTVKFFSYAVFILLLPIKFISGSIFNFLDIFDRKKNYTHNYNCIYEKVS